jgi:uncharacterized membrane protein YeaQ/YmgE (transglycosylase-associated protein family)
MAFCRTLQRFAKTDGNSSRWIQRTRRLTMNCNGFSFALPQQQIGRWQMGLIVFLIVGAIAGWLAGQVVKGGGFGLIGDIVVGILGAIIAGFLFPSLGISLGAGLIGEIISAAIGAIILLFVIRLVKRS